MNKFKKYLAYITVFNVLIGAIFFGVLIGAIFLGAVGIDSYEMLISILLILPTEFALGLFLLIPSGSRTFGQALILSSIIGLILGFGVCTIIVSFSAAHTKGYEI